MQERPITSRRAHRGGLVHRCPVYRLPALVFSVCGFPPGSAETKPAAAAPAAMPVSVAVVEPRQTVPWDEFSGRLEAVERVDVRSRVAGAVQAVHFRRARW